jgi:SEC-C motif domain protein
MSDEVTSAQGGATSCPCGAGASEAACCGRYLSGEPAPTALALMRSRYTAYVRGAIDHLVSTHAAATRGAVDVDAVTRWSRETTWQGLEIVATERGGAGDDDGVVEFIARGTHAGRPFVQRERSQFRRTGGRWYYAGIASASSGRNALCHCGSGKKLKRCHGA